MRRLTTTARPGSRFTSTGWQSGVALDEPHTRQLAGKLRELRFYLGGRPTRITYWIGPEQRIILLTVFVKAQRRERAEIRRAQEAMERCMAEGHTATEEE